ncbi:MAG: hypothetical protein WD625_00850, partial [Balneolales bacterium]
NLQRSYLNVIKKRLNKSSVNGETRAVLRGNLRVLDQGIKDVTKDISDNATRYHLNDVTSQIDRILNGE